MDTFLKAKTWIITLVIVLVAIILSIILVFFENRQEVNFAQAGEDKNINGFAWNSNYGWVSFNSLDCDTDGDGNLEGVNEGGGITPAPAGCPSSGSVIDYGVNLDSNGNSFSGLAWNSNLGWICVGEECQTSTSNIKVCSNDDDIICLNTDDCGGNACNAWQPSMAPDSSPTFATLNSGNLEGWANVLSMGDSGWIQFNGTNYGVTVSNGNLEGYAWGGSDVNGKVCEGGSNDGGICSVNANCPSGECVDIAGFGWLSFSCNDNNICATSDYQVSGDLAPAVPTNLATSIIACNIIKLNWDDNSDNETGFEVEISSNGLFSGEQTSFCDTIINRNYCSGFVSPSSNNYFRVRALGGVPDPVWEPISGGILGKTNYCSPDLSLSAGYNCDQVTLEWTQNGTGINYYEILKSDGGAFGSIATTTAEIFTYIDTDIESGVEYSYYVIARDDLDVGVDSNIIGPIKPCSNTPIWKERRTR